MDFSGKHISSKQYLENALNPVQGCFLVFFSPFSLLHFFSLCMRLTPRTDKSGGDRNKTKNEIRKTISQFFRERDCVTLVRPTVNEKELRHIDKVIFFLFCFYSTFFFLFLSCSLSNRYLIKIYDPSFERR